MDINELEQIIGILKKNDVTEFELKEGSTEIRLTRTPHGGFRVADASHGAPEVQHAIISPTNGQPSFHAAPQPAEMPSNLKKVESPIVGTFYRKPSPDAPPFAKEGDRVAAGDTLCIVEAMKLMNEIDSPCSGTIEKILVADGEVVEFGEVLFLIKPD